MSPEPESNPTKALIEIAAFASLIAIAVFLENKYPEVLYCAGATLLAVAGGYIAHRFSS